MYDAVRSDAWVGVGRTIQSIWAVWAVWPV